MQAAMPWLAQMFPSWFGGGGGGADGGGGGGWKSALGAGLSFLPMLFSDERLKDDHGIIDVVPIHAWNYKGDDKMMVGPMAQDVERVMPKAVGEHTSGAKMIDLTKLAGVMAGA